MQKVRTFFLYAILILILFQSISFAQDINNKLDKTITNYADLGYLNGVILVAEKGNIIYSNAFGFANLEWNIPNNRNTKFRIYSMSKQLHADGASCIVSTVNDLLIWDQAL